MNKFIYILEEDVNGTWLAVGAVTRRKDALEWSEGKEDRFFSKVPLMDKTFAQMVTQNNAYEG